MVELTVEGREAAQSVIDAGTKPWGEAAAEVGDAPFKLYQILADDETDEPTKS